MSSPKLPPLTLSSPPQLVMASLRRDAMLGQIEFFRPSRPSDKTPPLDYLKNVPLNLELGAAHVYDLDHLFDPDHPAYIGEKRATELRAESQERLQYNGVFLPFPATVFLERGLGVGQPMPAHPSLHVTLLVQSNDVIYLRAFYRPLLKAVRHWMFVGAVHYLLDRPGDMLELFGFDLKESRDQLLAATLTGDALATLALLNQPRPVTVVEPSTAPGWLGQGVEPRRSFEKENPVVNVVRIGQPQVLPKPDPQPTGITVAPHDRRAHLRRCHGRVIPVRASKVHGGYRQPPPPSVVRLAAPQQQLTLQLGSPPYYQQGTAP